MKASINNFTIYLLQKKIPFKNYICDDVNILHNKQLNKSFFKPNNRLKIEGGKVIITENKLANPDWLALINNIITQKKDIDLESRNDWSAIFFLRLEGYDYTVAIAFGRMNGILKEELMINDFGFITSKQIVDSNKIKNINIQSFDEKQTKINKQSVKLLNEFKILPPFELNTIKQFKGNTSISNTELEVGGRMGLRVKGNINVKKDLLNLLDEILNAYDTRAETEPKFKISDTIKTITDPQILNSLNKKLHLKLENMFVGKIDNNKTRNLSIVPDTNIDFDDFKGYHITGLGIPTTTISEELDLLYIFERIKLKLPKSPDKDEIIKKIKNMKINCKYNNSTNDHSISFYNSLCLEITNSKIECIFTGGIWYELNEDFYKHITDKIAQVSTTPAIEYINYNTNLHDDENEYNDDLIEKTNTISLDCTKYKPTKEIRDRSNISPQSNIELADVLYQEGNRIQFIHVKKKKSASQTNHLFAQAKASAQLYINDRVNVQNFINNEVQSQGFELINFENPYKLQVALAIIMPESERYNDNKKDTFTLLERISLYETIEILKGLGFEVFINFINSNLKKSK